jgi:hypothetical protein
MDEPQTDAAIGSVTYDPTDDKLRVYFDSRQPADDLEPLKAVGFRWAGRQECWHAHWSPSRVDVALKATGSDALDDEAGSLAERAAERSDRFEQYSDNASKEAAERYQQDRARCEQLNGQPILVGHHSEKRHRGLLRRMWANWDKQRDANKRADYWSRRAATPEKWARYKDRAEVRARRIKKLEADARRYARELVKHERSLKLCGQGASWRLLKAYCGQCDGATPYSYWSRLDAVADAAPDAQATTAAGVLEDLRKYATSQAEHWQRWHDHVSGRIAYERDQLGQQGGTILLEKKPRPKLPPILNIEEGVDDAWRMTSAEFSRKRRAQYASLTICGEGENKHRRRRALVRETSGGMALGYVFLTDKKAHAAPEFGGAK